MKLTNYLKDKITIIIITIISIILITLLDIAFKVPEGLIIVTIVLLLLTLIISLLISYFQKRTFLITNTKNLDKKYLVIETIPKPNTYEEELIYNIMCDINKSMIENVSSYINSTKDFKDYIEMWIHEVKIPISSLILMTHNHKNQVPKEYIEEIKRLDNYIDQILYYVRSNYTSEDFIFKKVKLEKIISSVALKNKDDLLENKIDLIVDIKNTEVYTDTKWLEFILNQIEKVQSQLLDLKNTVNNIGCVADCDYNGEEGVTVHDEVAVKKITALTEVFHHREESLQMLLELYGKMYDDLTGKKILKSKALAALEKCSGNDEQMKKLSGIMTEIGFLEE